MRKTIPLRTEKEPFTDNQWQAVFDGDANILVSASAGSGKTTVLVRRVIEKIKQGIALDRLLIVTYTEAAAKEMKARIQSALQQEITRATESETAQFFARQLALLPMATISTLHAFCLTVVRRFYYLIDVDPTFRLLTDETEILLLKEEVWETLRETWYQEQQEMMYQLSSNFSNDRGDDGLTQLVFALYEFAKANPDPHAWLAHLADVYLLSDALAQMPIYQTYLKPYALALAQQCLQRATEQLETVSDAPELAKFAALFQNEQAFFAELTMCLKEDHLEAGYACVQRFSFARFPTIRQEEWKETAAEMKALREQNKQALKELTKLLFVMPPKEMADVMRQAAPLVRALAALGHAFIQAYGAEKQRRNLVDFNDLEHFTLAILTKDQQTQASEASDYYRTLFEEVLVDEYQDINRLQETILSWLSHAAEQEGNLFMVGDVKQSIYSFRLADPTLFIGKYLEYEKNEAGKRIILAENFRSRSNVLDFTNFVFQQLMDPQVGQLAYEKNAHLIAGFPFFEEDAAYDTEILIYEKQQPAVDFAPQVGQPLRVVEDKTEGELAMVAMKIRQYMQEGFLIYDKKLQKKRPITYRDIVLLTPTKKNNLTIVDVFKKAHIPVQINDVQNYFQATEVQTIVNVLQLIDNPYQDIPLAAVLRSPVVGLKENELAMIRLAQKESDYYTAFQAFNAKKTLPKGQLATWEKTQRFATHLAAWREYARQHQLADLLWRIYQDTGYLDYVGGLLSGKQRQANLFALIDRATRYEQTNFRGLFQFIRLIEKMQEKDKDLAEAAILSEENTVRVMTIHASKGLEFPLVFVLDLTKEFNLSDVNARYIFDDRLGVGIRYLAPKERILADTLPFTAIKQARIQKLLSEEMRKLYVAFTRAEQKLFLVGSYQDQAGMWKEWQKGAQDNQTVLPAALRLQVKSSLMNWIGMSLIRHPKMRQYWADAPQVANAALTEHAARFQISFTDEQQLQAFFSSLSPQADADLTPQAVASEDLVTQARQRLDFQYPYALATSTTNYQSVSEIKRVFEDPDDRQTAKIDLALQQKRLQTRIIHRMAQDQLAKPAFLAQTKTPLATEVGSATHYVLQRIALTKTPTQTQVEQMIQECVTAEIFSSAVAKKIDSATLAALFQTAFGQLLIQHAPQVKREQPFSMLMDAAALIQDYPNQTHDQILIHGMIDGYLEFENECLLFDYKTDHAPFGEADAIAALTKRYQGQLTLYQRALEESTQKPVTAAYLILLNAKCIVDVRTQKIVETIG